MRLLREERGLTRWQAMRFGQKWRAKQVGSTRSVVETLSIVLADTVRQLIRSTIRFGLFVPLRLLFKLLTTAGKAFSGDKQGNNKGEAST